MADGVTSQFGSFIGKPGESVFWMFIGVVGKSGKGFELTQGR
jgi:hypothetical protein